MSTDPRARSRVLLDGPDRAVARSMVKAAGFTDRDLARPQIGVAHCWIGTMPCNLNHRGLAQQVMAGIRDAGGTPIEVNPVAINDGITTGTEGMKTSLVSREVIADSVELVARGHLFDGLVTIAGCDKTIPAMAMALGRLDIPGLTFYGGSIQPGRCTRADSPFAGRALTIQEIYEAVGAFNAGTLGAEDLRDVEDHACPGAGACGGPLTANTMATGGSTNAVLHLLAMAREFGVPLSLDDFDRISRRIAVELSDDAIADRLRDWKRPADCPCSRP